MGRAPLVLVVLSIAWAHQSPKEVGSAEDDSSRGIRSSRALARQFEHESTDERIKGYEKLLQSNGEGEAFKAGLVGAYLQKVRETSDFSYLDRASRLVDEMLTRDGSNFAALRYQNEVDLQRHEFRTVA